MSELSRNLQQALYLCLIRWRHKLQSFLNRYYLFFHTTPPACERPGDAAGILRALLLELTTAARQVLHLSGSSPQAITEALGQEPHGRARLGAVNAPKLPDPALIAVCARSHKQRASSGVIRIRDTP